MAYTRQQKEYQTTAGYHQSPSKKKNGSIQKKPKPIKNIQDLRLWILSSQQAQSTHKETGQHGASKDPGGNQT
ncbi:conserved hypothetical protein [delta proteobacterium NaphS2]|nr:conserved hypothetical protein [delta proteobacterium NaphS2]